MREEQVSGWTGADSDEGGENDYDRICGLLDYYVSVGRLPKEFTFCDWGLSTFRSAAYGTFMVFESPDKCFHIFRSEASLAVLGSIPDELEIGQKIDFDIVGVDSYPDDFKIIKKLCLFDAVLNGKDIPLKEGLAKDTMAAHPDYHNIAVFEMPAGNYRIRPVSYSREGVDKHLALRGIQLWMERA